MELPFHIIEHIASFCDIDVRRALKVYKKIDMTLYESVIGPKIGYDWYEKNDILLYKKLTISENKCYILAKKSGNPVVINIVCGIPVTCSFVGVQRVELPECRIS